MSPKSSLPILTLSVALSACGSGEPVLIETPEADPMVARALFDPLMVDPDLAYRNEVNAALTIGFDHALPTFEGSDQAARRAREVARLALIENGAIVQLPEFDGADAGRSLKHARGNAIAMSGVYGLPERCTNNLSEGYEWAADMPAVADIMPHGMVRQAAGLDVAVCEARLVTYLTPASESDVLEWHYNLARRADLDVSLFNQPELALWAKNRGLNVAVHVTDGGRSLTLVDIIYWRI